MVCCFLLQKIFPTQGLNLHLLCLLKWQADSLSPHHLGSPSISTCVLCLVIQSCPTLCDPIESQRLLHPWDSPGKNTGVGCRALLQGIFPTQGLNLHLLYLLHWQEGALPLAPPGRPQGGEELSLNVFFGERRANRCPHMNDLRTVGCKR